MAWTCHEIVEPFGAGEQGRSFESRRSWHFGGQGMVAYALFQRLV